MTLLTCPPLDVNLQPPVPSPLNSIFLNPYCLFRRMMRCLFPTDFAEGPQPMEVAQPDTASTVDAQTVEDPPSARFTWTIENFSRLNTKKLYSDVFYVGGYNWRVLIFPKGNNVDHLSMYLDVADSATLPYGWSRYAQFSLAVINQIHSKFTIRKDTQHQFNACESDLGFTSFMPLAELYDPARGYLVNDTCIVEANVAVRRVIDCWTYDSKETGYVGLKNQGATCYMNSSLQTLYHISHFRKAVYHMPTTENDMPSGSIPLAPQSLFHKLQYSDTSVATKELTKSFGWDSYDSFMQHDVQELNRVLCEKLEDKMNGSISNANNQSLGGSSSKISSIGSGIFGFSASPSTANNQTLSPITFGAGSGSLVSAQASSPAGTGFAASSQSMLTQFGLAASSSTFGPTGAVPLNSSNCLFGSSVPAKLFGSSSSGLSSSVSLPGAPTTTTTTTSISSASGITSCGLGPNWQTTKLPLFGSTSSGFSFGGSSALVAGNNSAPMVFGSSTSASSNSIFAFNWSATPASLPSFSSSQPSFGNPNPRFSFGSHWVQASTPQLPVLGQQSATISSSASPAFVFGSAAPSGGNPFQFGIQQNHVTTQNPANPLQSSSGNLNFNASGSFSLGTSDGGDNNKSNRKMIKVNRLRRRK